MDGSVGEFEGWPEGWLVGSADGCVEGWLEGLDEGWPLGADDGIEDGIEEALFRLAVDQGWTLTELHSEVLSLEQVFTRLTMGEN